MDINFGNLHFTVADGVIRLCGHPITEVQIEGRNKASHYGSKMIRSSEGDSLSYVSHELSDGRLTVVQTNDLIRTATVFSSYSDTNAVSVYTEIENISDGEIVLNYVSAFVYYFVGATIDTTKDTYLYKFMQCHHGECQPRKYSLYDLGLFNANPTSQTRIANANVGSWSTKEELPQGIVEYDGRCVMYQLESNGSRYCEISDNAGAIYLYLGGATSEFGSWSKRLAPRESYRTVTASLAFGDGIDGVIGEMTKYRRHIAGKCEPDSHLPVIFNEYMHLSWDNPTEEATAKIAVKVAEAGAEYYVIDCGWHDEEDKVYPYVGKWIESKKRFPNGLKKTTDFIRSLGMKPGLWIEPEIVGCRCTDMIDYYGDGCFITRYGKKVCVHDRHFLDFRREKVRSTMTETIRRMVEDYGADYVKMDYNQDIGIGTDKDSDSFGEGLEACSRAYLGWVDSLRRTFPDVLIETCSSGGLRMDYETLKHFSIVSTSDQTNYRKYPYIAGNILSAVLPEQAAVWSYPVDVGVGVGTVYEPSREQVDCEISSEQIAMNMVNSFLGRMHLAGRINLLSDGKFALVTEGVEYCKSLSEVKKTALPYFPLGFTEFGAETVAAGFKQGGKTYLAVWNLGGDGHKEIGLDFDIASATVAYPKGYTASHEGNRLILDMPDGYSARFIEIE